jgi:nicotinate-nucleotide pyrophosphorylase
VSTPRGTARSDSHRPVSVLIRVRGVLPNLRPAEQRVAQVVLAVFAGVAQRSYDQAIEALQSTSEVVQTRHAARV